MAIAQGIHPFPFRTRRLSPATLMVLAGRLAGRVSSCQFLFLCKTHTSPLIGRRGNYQKLFIYNLHRFYMKCPNGLIPLMIHQMYFPLHTGFSPVSHIYIWRRSSVGQSIRFIPGVSRVRISPPPPKNSLLPQWVFLLIQ